MAKAARALGFLRHDVEGGHQDEIFKWLDEGVQAHRNPNMLPNLMQAHIYTIDIFLWRMASMGYTLQKTEEIDLPFLKVKDVIADAQAASDERTAAWLNAVMEYEDEEE